MIDRQKGKVDAVLDKLLDSVKTLKEKVKEKLSPFTDAIHEKSKEHPTLSKIVKASVYLFVCGMIFVGFATPRTVYVTIDDSRQKITTAYETTCFRVDSFLEKHNIDYDPTLDTIDAVYYDHLNDGSEINIAKPFELKLEADGQTLKYTTFPITTKELIDILEVSVGPDDIVEPAMDQLLLKGDKVVVKRVTYEYSKEQEEIDYNVVEQKSSSIAIGETKVTQQGEKGLLEKSYKHILVDGKEVKKVLTGEKILKEKKDKIISWGTKFLSGVPADLSYKKKISGVKAVSYYFGGNPRGAYGLPCEYGTVAVDRSLIPLGSLLYIEGYGYAIANDVGSAIKGKVVDLYMERLEQCYIWGAKRVNVYIIEYGSN